MTSLFGSIGGTPFSRIEARIWLNKETIPLWQLPIQCINFLGADVADK